MRILTRLAAAVLFLLVSALPAAGTQGARVASPGQVVLIAQAEELDVYSIDQSFGFALFGKGDGRGCENVLTGRWEGLPLREADYWYYDETSDGRGGHSRSYKYFSVVVADLPCALPHVSIERENVMTRMADHLGFHDIEFESEQFNRMFKVKAQDREFAFKLLDARMINWMQSTGGHFGFEVNGPSLLVWSNRRPPTELIPLLGCAKLFCDHIPRLVWTQYGTTPARPDDPAATEERSTS